MAKLKLKCEVCGAVFGMIEDECPKCGSEEIYEIEDENIDPFELFDSPCSPCDTIGGI